MTNKLLALACLAALSVAACNRDEPARAPGTGTPPSEAPATAATPAATTAPAPPPTDVISATPNAAPAPEGATAFDQKAFAGRFSGGGATLELKPDGGYVMEDSQGRMDGTWTVEAENKRIRLDPNTKAQDDRLFSITGPDELGPLDAGGKPASGQTGLRREGASAAR